MTSLKSQLALSASFGPTRSSVKQPATTAVEELGESQEKTLEASNWGLPRMILVQNSSRHRMGPVGE
jgi:hypothetical protein